MGERLTKLVKLVYVTAQDSPKTFFYLLFECFVSDVFSRQLVLGVSSNTLLLLFHVKPKHEHWLIHLTPTPPPSLPPLSLSPYPPLPLSLPPPSLSSDTLYCEELNEKIRLLYRLHIPPGDSFPSHLDSHESFPAAVRAESV